MNLNVQAKTGWCLWYVQEVLFGKYGHKYDFAEQAWQDTEFRHSDRDIPNGVPVFFSWFNAIKGIEEGHIVLKLNDKFFSSPRSGIGFEIFDTIESIEQAFYCKFVGWSEDLNNERLKTMPTEKDVREYFLTYEGREPTTKEIRDYTAKSWRYLTDKLLASMKKRLTIKPTQLKPGVYKV
jgi:hypothetical protein